MGFELKYGYLSSKLIAVKFLFCVYVRERPFLQAAFKIFGNAKECWNYGTIALNSHASKVMLKILQARLQQYVNRELPDVQAGFRKGRGTRDQTANIHWIMEKARELQKNIYFCFIVYAKAFDCVDHNQLWKILREMEYQTIWPASWEICMQVRKQQLELDMEQQTGSK